MVLAVVSGAGLEKKEEEVCLVAGGVFLALGLGRCEGKADKKGGSFGCRLAGGG